MNNEETRLDFIEKHAPRALYHYAHAKKKHPYFCDNLLPRDLEPPELPVEEQIALNLARARRRIESGAKIGNLLWNEILNCEVWEATEAIYERDYAHAVEELHDAIAVLLRTIDVLEGRQKLGKPETKGGNQ